MTKYDTSTPQWRLIYRHDTDGKALVGTKAALLAAIRAGAPVRVGWGAKFDNGGRTSTVEHVVDPVFLSIVDGAEVVVQLPEHIAQRSYVDSSNVGFDNAAVMWRGLMSTDGTFDAVWVHRASGAEVRRVPQRAAIAWFVFQSDPPVQPSVELALAGGVKRSSPPRT